jgi:hypothetical protein
MILPLQHISSHLQDRQSKHEEHELARLVGERQLLQEGCLAKLVKGGIVLPDLNCEYASTMLLGELTFLSSSEYY